MDDVLEFPTVQVKSRFVRLILYNFVSKRESTHGVYIHVCFTLTTFK
jgi:5-carboxymethyl-2-hydroxymuconate isomerase